MLDLTAFSYGLKTVYDSKKVLSTVYQYNPALARMPKNTSFPGENFAYAVRYAPVVGRSATFATARTNKSASLGKKFVLTRVKDYALGSIDTETLLASENDTGALLQATKAEADGAMEAMSRSMGIGVFGNGAGALGTVESPGASTTLTLEQADDITNFEVGMVLVFAANDTSALRDSGATLTVVAVNRDAGTMTMSANVTTITGITDGDSIFAQGDYVSASDRNKLAGFAGWIPATAPTGGDSWFSVDRSADVTRLAGVRYSSTTHPGLTTYEAIMLLASRIGREGFSPDTCYLGFDRFRGLVNSIESKAVYNKDPEIVKIKNAAGQIVAELAFDAIRLHGPRGAISIMPDQNCPEETIWVQQLSSWELKSMGEAPRWLMFNGSKLRTEDTTDSVEFRLALYGNIRCLCPAANGRYDF